MRVTKILILFFTLLFYSHIPVYSTTITASSCSYSDVSSAVSSASEGDTIIIPSGNCSWSTTLTITKGIKLEGAGVDSTIIMANGITTIISFQVNGDHYIEVTGLTLDGNNVADGKCLEIVNSSSATEPLYNCRVHHCKFKNAGYMSIRTKGNVYGLIDHNEFVNNTYDFKILGNDEETWADFPGLPNIGSKNYLYIEDNTSTGVTEMVILSGEGARWVYRYNSIDVNKVPQCFDAHGDTSNAGVVAHEIYENSLWTSGVRDDTTPGYKFHDLRGGTGIVYNNDMDAGTSGVRTYIHVREEYDSCTDPAGCDSTYTLDEVNNSYIWNNVNTRDNKIIAVWEADTYNHIAEDENWWDDAVGDPGGESPSNFNYGLSLARPSTCSDDDCYWETDTKKLYRCEGTNNWVFIYHPYQYPHPLQGRQTFKGISFSGGISTQ